MFDNNSLAQSSDSDSDTRILEYCAYGNGISMQRVAVFFKNNHQCFRHKKTTTNVAFFIVVNKLYLAFSAFHRGEEFIVSFGHCQLIDKKFHACDFIHWM